MNKKSWKELISDEGIKMIHKVGQNDDTNSKSRNKNYLRKYRTKFN